MWLDGRRTVYDGSMDIGFVNVVLYGHKLHGRLTACGQKHGQDWRCWVNTFMGRSRVPECRWPSLCMALSEAKLLGEEATPAARRAAASSSARAASMACTSQVPKLET